MKNKNIIRIFAMPRFLCGRHNRKCFRPLWEIRSFIDRRYDTFPLAHVYAVSPFLGSAFHICPSVECISSFSLSRPCEASHKTNESRLHTFVLLSSLRSRDNGERTISCLYGYLSWIPIEGFAKEPGPSVAGFVLSQLEFELIGLGRNGEGSHKQTAVQYNTYVFRKMSNLPE